MPPAALPSAVSAGVTEPLGATTDARGVNFALRAPDATHAELLLYRHSQDVRPYQAVELDRSVHFDHGIWHVHVAGVAHGTLYTWRLDGPDDTAASGHRFDPLRELVDPYARAVDTSHWRREDHLGQGPAVRHRSIRAIVLDLAREPAVDDAPLHIPLELAVIYEMHVGGFTRGAGAEVTSPGTFLGVIERIPYLQSLGVTHVELLPIFAFDEQEVPPGTRDAGLRNYWGYSTYSFFAPHPGYATSPDTARHEFRQMVKALHEVGIGVILDVVFNHTAEGGAGGAVINFKGAGNAFYYMLSPEDRRQYQDYTGCGNTINANHPWVLRMILDCLRYWVREMHVDGFRFDIASALTRLADGSVHHDAPAAWAIELEPVLAKTHLIAECWDAAGLYQVGSFPGLRWAEWNGRYRDCVRRFVHGQPGAHAELAARIAGSADMYQGSGRTPRNSVNFVTCHDGFTLADLVSYERKHNEANGEGNRDGGDHNFSRNHGVEGDTDRPEVLTLRARQVRNHLTLLLLSQGAPMINAGDEVLRSQQGNNNPWCQDNPTGWFDWESVVRHAHMLHFVRELIALRRRHQSLQRRGFLTGKAARGALLPDIQWHGRRLHRPNWEDGEARELAFTLAGVERREPHLHVMVNMADRLARFMVPRYPGIDWRLALDTAGQAGQDIRGPTQQQSIAGEAWWPVQAHAIVVLEGWDATLAEGSGDEEGA
ncbi:MAG: glycogen debranching protein GlgX [Pseudomonadota bacterium]